MIGSHARQRRSSSFVSVEAKGFTATQRTNNNDFKKTQSEALEFHDQEMKNMKIFQMNIKTFI